MKFQDDIVIFNNSNESIWLINICFDPGPRTTWGSTIFPVYDMDKSRSWKNLKIVNPPCPNCEDILDQVSFFFWKRDAHYSKALPLWTCSRQVYIHR